MTDPQIPLLVRVAQDRQRAIDVIRNHAGRGNSLSYIAGALDRAQVPTLAGRPGARWRIEAIRRLAAEAAIKL